jgi:hypothetical protein
MKDGLHNHCKKCNKDYRERPGNKERKYSYQKEWSIANRERRNERQRNANMKMNHGITLDDFNQMFDGQDGKCPICGNLFESREGRKIHVDHNHETGLIRDLLCNHCNLLIGYAKENINTLLGAIAYLEKWQKERIAQCLER